MQSRYVGLKMVERETTDAGGRCTVRCDFSAIAHIICELSSFVTDTIRQCVPRTLHIFLYIMLIICVALPMTVLFLYCSPPSYLSLP